MDSSLNLFDGTNTRKRKSVEKESMKSGNWFYCEICAVKCNSKEMIDSNKGGLKHRIKEAQNSIIQKTSDEKEYKIGVDDNNDEMKTLWCKICNVKCSGEATMLSHLNGKKHKSNKLKTGGEPKVEVLNEDGDLQKKRDDFNVGKKDEKCSEAALVDKITDGSWCLVCKAKFWHQVTLIMHLNGNYHKSEEDRLRRKKKIEKDEVEAKED